MSIVDSFRALNPNQKKIVAGSAIAGGIVAISFVLSTLSNPKKIERSKIDPPEVDLVKPLQTVGIENFSETLQSIQQELRELKRIQRQIEAKQAKMEAETNKPRAIADEPLASDNDSSIPLAQESNGPIDPVMPDEAIDDFPDETYIGPDASINQPPMANTFPNQMPNDDDGFSQIPAPEPTPSLPPALAEPTAQPSSGLRIVSESGDITDKLEAFTSSAMTESQEKEQKVYIPAGSMFTGVLLNGLDATTATAAQKNPIPVVMRVKREAVLPNYASIDVRECFVLAAGYGQLATERAVLRTETMSCVRNDGQVFEQKINGYVVGGDGKVGLPGRLVSKHGQLIAQSLMAGMLSGISDSFSQTEIPSLNIDPTGSALYQSSDIKNIFQNSMSSGFSSAANQVANFYLKMAEETFPVVEVPAGEVGTIIMTSGGQLPLKGSTDLQLYADNAQMAPKQPVVRNDDPPQPPIANPHAVTASPMPSSAAQGAGGFGASW